MAKSAQVTAISDVTHASEVLADPTSVPIITTPQAVTDPMVTTIATKTANKMRIEPLHETELAAAAVHDSHQLNRFEDEVVAKPISSARADALATQQQAEHDTEIAKLIESRHYYLPINQVQRKRTKQLVWISFGIVLVLGFAWLYLLLDAGLVTIPGITAPTHFFK